jgi:hypothetical protein
MSLCAVGLPGCFDAPPEYSAPERLPPLLDEAAATPPISSLYVESSPKINLTIPFRVNPSEDDVQAVFVIDLGTEDFAICFDKPLPGDTRFGCNETWSRIDQGCHRITVRASYVSNFRDNITVDDASLATEATWFAALEDAQGTADCFPEGVP